MRVWSPIVWTEMLRLATTVNGVPFPNWKPQEEPGAKSRAQSWMLSEVVAELEKVGAEYPGQEILVSRDVEPILRWLKATGYSFESDRLREGDITAAGTFAPDLKPRYSGRYEEIQIGDARKSGVLLQGEGVKYFRTPFRHPYPIAQILLGSGDKLFVTKVSQDLPVDKQLLLSLFGVWDYFQFCMEPIEQLPGVVIPAGNWVIDEVQNLMEGIRAKHGQEQVELNHVLTRTVIQIETVERKAATMNTGKDKNQRRREKNAPMMVDSDFWMWIQKSGWDWPVMVARVNVAETSSAT